MVVQLRKENGGGEVVCVGNRYVHMQKLAHFGQNRFLLSMVHFDMRIKSKLAETALLHQLKGLFMLITMVQIPASYMYSVCISFKCMDTSCLSMAIWNSEIC